MADKPVTREEKYLAYLTGDYNGELPKPITRKEKYLYELCLKGMGDEIANQCGGMSTTAINLLIEILEVGMFTTNVSAKIESLKEALLAGSSGDSGEDSGGGETVADDITVSNGVMTIVTVGSMITVSNGIMSIA